MSLENPHRINSELQTSIEDEARLSVDRVKSLIEDGTDKLHSNGSALDQDARQVPSFSAPIVSDTGVTVGEWKVYSRGLNDRPREYGYALVQTIGIPQIDRAPNRHEYWMDSTRGILFFEDPGMSRTIKDSKKLVRCSAVDTIEVMEEVRGVLEAALYPERQRRRSEAVEPEQTASFIKQVLRRFRKSDS